MKDLFNVTILNDVKVVSAKELYIFLGYDISQWSRWSNKNISKNEFAIENVDYQLLDIKSSSNNGTFIKDFALSLDFSKRLSMMARTEKGEEARNYFIAIEKKAISKPRTHLEVIQSEMALLIQNEQLQIENNKMRPRSEFVELVFNSDSLLDIGEVAKVLKLSYGRNKLFRVLRDKNIFFKHKNEPYQKYIDKGYFELKEKHYESGENKLFLTTQTFATQKGLGFIAKSLGLVFNPNLNIQIAS